MPQPQPASDVLESVPASGREIYLRTVVAQLTAALRDVLGSRDAEAFVSIASRKLCDEVETAASPSRAEIPAVLIELQRRIGADFYLSEETPDSIIVGNRVCPFGAQVRGLTSLCMTTSNLLGSVTAKHLGYARIDLRRTIAQGEAECLIVIHFSPSEPGATGHEYFGQVNADLTTST